MDIQSHDRVGAHRLKQRGHIARGDRIARLGLPILFAHKQDMERPP